MDFANRSNHQPPAPTRNTAAYSADMGGAKTGSPAPKHSAPEPHDGKWAKFTGLFAIAMALFIAAVLGSYFTMHNNSESDYVNKSQMQAVFLVNTSGVQTYFGHITNLNSKFMVLNDIYYLQSSAANNSASDKSSTSSNVSLIKLGCELHKPYDQMIINRSQVEFWENLQAGGKVSTAISSYRKAHPNGQTCTDTTNSTGSDVQGTAGGSTGASTGTPNTTGTTSTTTPTTGTATKQ